MNKIISFVDRGIGLGGKLGIPTLNLDPDKVPKTLTFGIYICEVDFDGNTYKGAMHYGPKSFGVTKKKQVYLEIHVLDFDQDIYNMEVEVRILKKIRDVREFESKEKLVQQIKEDISITKKYFKNV